jgi:TolB protein
MSQRRRLQAIATLVGAITVVSMVSGGAAFSAPSGPVRAATEPGKNGPIAFRRYFDNRHTTGAVFTIRANGTGVRQVTHPEAGTVDDQADWAPDGSLITFTRCAPDTLCHVYVVAPDGTGLTPVAPLCPPDAHEDMCPDDEAASFSADSKQLTFTQSTGQIKPAGGGLQEIEHSAVAVMNSDGSGRRVIYQAPPYAADLLSPMGSPDGSQIVFEWFNSPFSTPANREAIYVINWDGSGLRRLTPWAENAGDNPDWSPDGRWILFHSHVDDTIQSQIFLIHPSGTGRKQITRFKKGTLVGSSSFSPDGKSIVFAKGLDGSNLHVYVMRIDGSHVRRVTRSKLWDSAPDWGPTS